MATPFLGEITLVPFDFPPKGWAFCDGQLFSIQQNTALFSVLGTIYGGDGETNFALPNLQGQVIVGMGQGNGLNAYAIGQNGGLESVTLEVSNLPSHNHYLYGGTNTGVSASPASNHFAASPPSMGQIYGGVLNGGHMLGEMLQSTGGGSSHTNQMPTLTLNYIIALQGIYPTRN